MLSGKSGEVYFLILIVISFFISFFLTAKVRNYALKKSILDIPNERSSHIVPTPRGGGLAVVVSFLFSFALLAGMDVISLNVFLALFGGGFLVAFLGWLDDKYSLSSSTRLLVQFAAAIWGLYCLNGFQAINIGFSVIELGWFGNILAVVGIVWIINLYNFMDGIDGIAGTQALMVAAFGGWLLLVVGSMELAILCFLLAASVAGFLIWNWEPAKIFMGDVGSVFLGYIFAMLAIVCESQGSIPLVIWMVILGVFIIDATLTLIRRIIQGEEWGKPHRTHVYQLAVQYGFKHKQVVIGVALINIILFTLAYLMLLLNNVMFLIGLGTFALLIILYLVLYRRFADHVSKRKEQGSLGKISLLNDEAAASKE